MKDLRQANGRNTHYGLQPDPRGRPKTKSLDSDSLAVL